MREKIDENKSLNNQEIPKTVLDYLEDKHKSIVNDYRTPDNKFSESCGLITVEIVELLLREGKKPYIMKVHEDEHRNGFIHSKRLAPKIYEGRIHWGAHQVCCCDGMAYDPILGKPISIKEYTKAVFDEDIKMEVLIPQEKIEEFINR